MNPLFLIALAGAGVAIASKKPNISSSSSPFPFKPYWKISADCTGMESVPQFVEGTTGEFLEALKFQKFYGTYLFKNKDSNYYQLVNLNLWTSYGPEFSVELLESPLFLKQNQNLDFYSLTNKIYGIRYNTYPCFKLDTKLSLFLYALELFFTARTLTINNYLDNTDFQNKIFKEIPDYLKELNVTIAYDPILAIDFVDVVTDAKITTAIYWLFYYNPGLYIASSTLLAFGFLYLPQFFMWDDYEKKYHIYDYSLKTVKNAKRFDRLIRNVDTAKKLWHDLPNKKDIYEYPIFKKYFPGGYYS